MFNVSLRTIRNSGLTVNRTLSSEFGFSKWELSPRATIDTLVALLHPQSSGRSPTAPASDPNPEPHE
eukprot:2608939-Rhodomonas_salina.2